MKHKIKTIIIDDETLAREIIKKYLNDFTEVELVKECENGFEGIKAINEIKPHLIFLDIQMPKLNGFEMLELIDEKPVVIFSTAYDQFALKAFEVNAADYLLKPFSKERFNEAMDKAHFHLINKTENEKVVDNVVSQYQNEKEELERVVVKSGSKINIIPIQEINYFEAQDDYVMIYTDSGKYLKQKTMKFFEDHLPKKDFIRIHRSYIVKISKIKQIELFEKDSYHVITVDGKSLNVSKSGYARLKELYN